MLIQGDLSFGPVAFMGAGAYTVALFIHYGISSNPIINTGSAVAISALLAPCPRVSSPKTQGHLLCYRNARVGTVFDMVFTTYPQLGGGTGLLVPYSAFLSRL